MLLRRVLRLLLEPARDPLRDSFGVSLERVAALRARLHQQIAHLHARAAALGDTGLDEQVRQLEAKHEKLLRVEQRVTGELDCHRARRDLLTARQTAAQAQERLSDLLGALDDAHAHAAALAESVLESPLEAADMESAGGSWEARVKRR
jgi:hypothetical protein